MKLKSNIIFIRRGVATLGKVLGPQVVTIYLTPSRRMQSNKNTTTAKPTSNFHVFTIKWHTA